MLESFHRKHSKPSTAVLMLVWGSCETSREHFWHIVPYGFSCYWSVDFSIYFKIFVIWFVSFYVLLSQWRMHFDVLNSKRSEEQTEVCKHFPVKKSSSSSSSNSRWFCQYTLVFACIWCVNVQHIRRICLPTVKTLTWYFSVVMQPSCICKMGIFCEIISVLDFFSFCYDKLNPTAYR